jgi:hypothetical protein
MNIVSLALPAGFTLAGVAFATRGASLARAGHFGLPKRPGKHFVEDAPLDIVATPLAVRPIGGASPAVPTPVEEEVTTMPDAAATLEALTLEPAREDANYDGAHAAPESDAGRVLRGLGNWFSIFTRRFRAKEETSNAAAEFDLEDGVVSEPIPYNANLQPATNGHATIAHEESEPALNGSSLQLDAAGLIVEAKTPAPAPDFAAMSEMERRALETAATLRNTRSQQEEEQRAAAERAEQAAANRWWVRLNPDLDPDDVDGRLAVTATLAPLRGVGWAQSLLADAIHQEPEPRIRARLYGVLARIGGADERRALYEAALSRSDADRAAAIDAVASAGVPWAMDFFSTAASTTT